MVTPITLTGTVEYITVGTGAWAIAAEDGETYEIYNGEPIAMRREGAMVTIEGFIRDDVMSFAAIGPIVEVISFQFEG
jgi:hypothetical protein